MSGGATAALVIGGVVVVGGGAWFFWHRRRVALAGHAKATGLPTGQTVGPKTEAKSGIQHFNSAATGNLVAGNNAAAVGPKARSNSSSLNTINNGIALGAGAAANTYLPGSGLIVAPLAKAVLPGAEKVGVKVGKTAYNTTKSVVKHLNPFSW